MDTQRILPSDLVRDWLLTSAVQITTGADSGGVAGWLNSSLQPEYLYLEITGYYLSSMAFIATTDPALKDEAVARAELALGWLERLLNDSVHLPTRKYINQTEQDWRNQAVFSFDIGMVIRGIAAILPLCTDRARCETLLAAYVDRLRPFFENCSTLKSHIALDNSVVMPDKWSTRQDPHQLKIVSGFLFVPSDFQDRECLLGVLNGVLQQCRAPFPGDAIALDMHPTHYYLEGAATTALHGYSDISLEQVAGIYRRIMKHQMPDGCLPSNLVSPDAVVRSDVIAQALRIGSILRDLGYLTDAQELEQLDRLYAALLKFIAPSGAVSFFPIDGAHPTFWNAWCAMFAHQALALYEQGEPSNSLVEEQLRSLI